MQQGRSESLARTEVISAGTHPDRLDAVLPLLWGAGFPVLVHRAVVDADEELAVALLEDLHTQLVGPCDERQSSCSGRSSSTLSDFLSRSLPALRMLLSVLEGSVAFVSPCTACSVSSSIM